jgi:hypothetical protein
MSQYFGIVIIKDFCVGINELNKLSWWGLPYNQNVILHKLIKSVNIFESFVPVICIHLIDNVFKFIHNDGINWLGD